MLKIGFDIGGVLSKYPHEMRVLLNALSESKEIELHCISDMHFSQIKDVLQKNDFLKYFRVRNIHSANYETFGDDCKAHILTEYEIDVMIDDRLEYLLSGCTIGLQTAPRNGLPYHHSDWIPYKDTRNS